MKRILTIIISIICIYANAQTVGRFPYYSILQTYWGDSLRTSFDTDTVKWTTNQKYYSIDKPLYIMGNLVGIGGTSNHDNLSGLTNAASAGAINGHLTNEQYSALQNQISKGSGGGSAYLLTISTAPTYNPDGSLKILKQAYVSDPTKYFEQRFEYTAGLASKIEIKDDIAGKWVRQTNIYDANGQLQVPTITDITEWTII